MVCMMQELTLEKIHPSNETLKRTNENLEQISKVLNFDADSKSKSWLSQLDKDGNGKICMTELEEFIKGGGSFFFSS